MTRRVSVRAAFAALAWVAAACASEPQSSSTDGSASSPTGGVNASAHLDAPHVVLVSSDGFGAELWGRHPTPNFDRVAAAGVRADAMIPVFPTKTFPTHYSIATGMYAETHGLVGNRFWAPDLGMTYSLSNRSAVEDGRFYRGEPIWVTAERQGMVAASFFFVGSEAPVGGVQPTHWYRFDAQIPHETRVDQVLEWLAMPAETRPHMITLYFEDVDGAFHFAGPEGPETAAAIGRVDRSLGSLLDGIQALPHGDRVYLILVSDHGLLHAPPELTDELDMGLFSGVRLAETGPYASLFVDVGGVDRARAVRDSIAALLPENEVWLRSEVPERFHYDSDPRIGDVVVLAAPGRRIAEAGRTFRDGWTHGWDNLVPEMAAIFLAMGPGIAPGQRIPAFEAVHVYPFIAHLLGLVPNAQAEGRLEVLRPIVQP